MDQVVVSERFEVTLPPSVCEALRIRPGQQLDVFVLDGRMVMMPTGSARELRGFLQGIDPTIERDPDRF